VRAARRGPHDNICWFMLAASVLMVREARRIGVRFVWA
jgi:hypothetical protein